MKKIYKICIGIIIVGVIINVILYVNKANKTNVSIKETKNHTEENIKDVKKETNKDNKDYYNIKRKSLERPIAYVINNIPQAWPQSGIYGADVIYEVRVEGGLTRLIAIFTRGDVNKIGPIRSARHDFLDISMEYDAIFAHFGGSPKAFEDIKLLNIPALNGIVLDGLMYWRDKSRKAPHNCYTSIDKTLEYAKRYGYNKQVPFYHFKFSENTNLNGQIANRVDICYSHAHNTSYIFDEKRKVYDRFMKGMPHIDELINTQLSAKNIIIQYANHLSMDDEDRQEIQLVGSGKGYYVTNGKYIEIKWYKPSRREKTIYFDNEGKEIILNKGQTWIQIVPTNSTIIIK